MHILLFFSFSISLQPLLPFKIIQHKSTYDQHYPQCRKITPLPSQLRHKLKIHPIQTGDERQWNKNGADDGKHFHDFVESIADAG